MATITLIDEAGFGNKILEKQLEFQKDTVTLRELIRQRVFQEVNDYNTRQPEAFQGLIQPSETEQMLNGITIKKIPLLNAETQFRKATELFSDRGFIVLINNKQMDSLDVLLDLSDLNEVTFLKLVPLIGG